MALLGLLESAAALAMLPVAFLLGLAFAGVALVITALADSYDFFVYYFTLVITPMMLVSGVFFPSAQLPPIVQSIAAALPLVHATELSRGLTVGAPLDGVLLHVAVITFYGVASVLLAIRLVRKRLARGPASGKVSAWRGAAGGLPSGARRGGDRRAGDAARARDVATASADLRAA